MSRKKYKQGQRINSISEFDQSSALYYIVHFGSTPKTLHRSFLISWQYRVLLNFINHGRVFEAENIDD